MSEPGIEVPAKFWQTLTDAEMRALFANDGWLTAAQCRRLWAMTDRQDAPPARLQMMFKREDIMRQFPPLPARSRGRK